MNTHISVRIHNYNCMYTQFVNVRKNVFLLFKCLNSVKNMRVIEEF